MSSEYGEDTGDRQANRLVQEMRKRLNRAQNKWFNEARGGGVSPTTHLDYAEAVVEFENEIREHRDEKVLQGEFPDISDIREKFGQQTTVWEEAAGDTSNKKPVQKPAVMTINSDRLHEAADDLKRAAKKLGLGPQIKPQVSGGVRLTADDIGDARFAGNSDFADSQFWDRLLEDVEGPREGGAIVIVDAEDARTGVGKTSAAVAFAKYASQMFNYQLQERDLVLSGQEYLGLYEVHPGEDQVSVAVWDEAVGAGSGDARRAMAQENVDLGRAWQIMRTRRVVSFVTLPDWGDLDSRLQKFADYRLWARRDIGEVNAYEVGTSFQGGDIRTRGLGPGDGAEPIAFPDMKEIEDRHYLALKAKKDELIESGTLDADELRDDTGDAERETETGPDLANIAEEVADNIDEYVSIHGGNKTKYLDADLIKHDFELSGPKADTVKKLVERRGVEI